MPLSLTSISSGPNAARVFTRYIAVVIVTGLSLVVTMLLWQDAAARARTRQGDALHHQTELIQERLEDQIEYQVLLVRAARAYFEASELVTPEEWRQFASSSGLMTSEVGISGLAFVRSTGTTPAIDAEADPSPDDAPSAPDQFDADRAADPGGLALGVSLEEPAGTGRIAVGFDAASRAASRLAYQDSRDRDEIRVSGVFSPGKSADASRALIVAAPVYHPDVPSQSVSERRVSIRGWVTAVIDLDAFFAGAAEQDWDRFHIEVFDAQGASVFSSLGAESHEPVCDGCPLDRVSRIGLGGYADRWSITVEPLDHRLLPGGSESARANLLGGLAVTLLMGLLTLTIARTRCRAEQIARSMTVSLTESERRMRQAESIARLGHWTWNIKTGDLSWSESIYRIFDVDPIAFEATYEGFLARVHPDDVPLVTDAVDRAVRGEIEYDIDHRIVLPSGEVRWVHELGEVSVGADGQPERMLGVVKDITDRRAALEAVDQERQRLRRNEEKLKTLAAEANEASEAKSRFLANMSHEIRTPMTAILGYSELLADRLVEAEGDTAISTSLAAIQRAGRHLLKIINNVLDLSKIESGHVGLDIEATNLPQLVAEVVEEMRVRADQKCVRLEAMIDGEAPDRVMTDRSRVRQILTNLVGNAVKFTDAGRVVVRLSAEDQTIRVDVEDTGPGIDAEVLPRLFNSFEQGDTSPSRQHEGTGLGLTICRSLAHLLGGEIEVSSRVGYGSTFSLTLPLLECPGSKQTTSLIAPKGEPKEPPPVVTRLHGRVLVVEDGPDNRRLIAHLLERHELEVDLAEHGQIALDKIGAGARYDLIVMDMQMPVLDGYEAVRLLREGGVRTPILALTAHAMTGDRERCIAAGCDSYLTKPIDRSQLIEQVATLLNRSAGIAA